MTDAAQIGDVLEAVERIASCMVVSEEFVSNKDSSALIGKVFQHKSGGMTAQYSVESLVSTSAVVDTYVAAPQAMAIKLFLKVLTPALTAQPGFSTRFQEIVAAMLKFASPNIIQLFDYGSNEEYFYLVLEYHKSPVLQHQLRDQGALPLDAALGALQGIAGALDLAASRQVYHGLLSPLSIHVSRSRGPMVTDWGLAQLIGGTRLPRALMDDPYLAAFVAPEVHSGQPPDALSDQYSLAATFYAMLTGKTPNAAMTNDPAVAQFRDTLTRALAFEPGARYSSTIEFYRALTASPAQAVAPAAPMRVAPVETPVASVNATPAALPPAPVKPVSDRTMIEPPPKPASPPPAPVQAQPAAAEHTMLEMSVEELKKAMPPPPEPVQPVPAKPQPAAAEHTMLEMSVEDLKKAMPPPPEPVQPVPAKPQPAAVEHTMLEMSVEELKKAMPAPPPAPIQPAPVPVSAAPQIDQTMPEMSAEEIRKAVEAQLAASQPRTEIIAENAPKRPADPPPAPAAPLIEQTMPEMSVEEIRRAAYAAMDAENVDTLDDDEIEGEEEFVDEEPDIPRRPSGELPPVAPPKPPSKPPVPAPVETERPANRPPTPQPVQEDELPPPPYVPQRARPVALDATMPEMPPAANLAPPDANRPQPRTPGLDATMTEMPAAQYDMPSMPPPLPGKQDTPSSVPYNFNTVQGGRSGQQGGRHIEHRYKTGTIDKDALNDAAHSDGLTGMLRSVPAPTNYRVPDSTDDNLPQQPRKRNYTILWIILALLLLGGAMTIGFTVLKALNVF